MFRPSRPIRSSEITPKSMWLNRRQLMAGAGAAATLLPMAGMASAKQGDGAKIATVPWSKQPADLKPTPYDYVTSYNNFYEFGTGKEDPAANAGSLTTEPWTDRDRRAGRQARRLCVWRTSSRPAARGAHLPLPLRRGLVDGRALGGLRARRRC